MSRLSCVRAILTCLVLTSLVSFAPSAQSPQASSADERLRALYTEEWKWRGQELARAVARAAPAPAGFPRSIRHLSRRGWPTGRKRSRLSTPFVRAALA